MTAAEGKGRSEDVVYAFETPTLCFYGLADGQSKKMYCREGAERALRRVSEFVAANGIGSLMRMNKPDLQCEVKLLLARTLRDMAEELRTDVSELNSTLLVFALDRESNEGLCFHIGDGILIGLKEDASAMILSSPENGHTLSSTYLTSSVPAEHIRIERIDAAPYDRILLATDGAWGVAVGRRVNPNLSKALENPEGAALAGKSQDDATLIEVKIETEDFNVDTN